MILLKSLFVNFFSKQNIKLIFKEIYRNLKENILLSAAIIVIAVVSILFFDKHITAYVIELKGPVALYISSLGYILGHLQYPLIVVLVSGTIFYYTKMKKRALPMLVAVHAMLLSGILVQIPKYLIGRQRPYAGYDNFSWFNNYHLFGGKFFAGKYMSMPSGDSITIAATCMVFAMYSKNKFAKLFFLLIPTITMFTRINLSKHWFSDTFIGLSLGFLIGKSVYDFYKNENIVLK